MKKIILLAAMLALIVSCAKDNPQPSNTTTPTTQTWNGLYCISFVTQTTGPAPTYIISYDTTGKVCGNEALLSSYNNGPKPFPGDPCGKKIFNCNQCK